MEFCLVWRRGLATIFGIGNVQMLVFFRILCYHFLSEDSISLRLRVFFLSNSLDFVLVWRRRLATMFRAGGANAGQPWRDHSVINAQSSLPPTNFNYFIYNLQLHYLLPAHRRSSCIIVQLPTDFEISDTIEGTILDLLCWRWIFKTMLLLRDFDCFPHEFFIFMTCEWLGDHLSWRNVNKWTTPISNLDH